MKLGQSYSRLPWKVFLILLCIPVVSEASFIEATMGTAVVNDATATFFNPAALTFLDNPQVIGLATGAELHSEFAGSVTQLPTSFTQSGTSLSHSNYYLPSGYLGIPITDKFFFGFAVVANNFNRDMDQSSILRYVMSDNNVSNVDYVPAIGVQLNDYVSIGANLDFSQADFLFTPIAGFPTIDIPDTQSRNEANADAWGGDVGLLLRPFAATQIGFNYRSSVTYHFHGTSQLETTPSITSNNFAFDYWTPARYVVSINQFLSRSLGMIGTVEWIQWDIYNKVNANEVATLVGPHPVILPEVSIPLHFHNAGIYTIGSYYNLSPKWIIRTAASYFQSPGNPNYQITEGNSIILGASMGYKLSKSILIDGSYAHAFIQNETISVQNPINIIEGTTSGYRDSVSLKVTLNV